MGPSIDRGLAMQRLRRLLAMGVEKKNLGHLPQTARIYILAVCAAAVAVGGYSATEWRSVHMGQFLLYVACGILCSNLKVCLPGVTSTLSVNYLFILASITDLTLAQTIVIGCTSGIAQLVLKARKRPRGVQVLFAFGSQTISSAAAYLVYHAGWMPDAIPFRLLGASATYFLSNSLSVASIIALSEGKSLRAVWYESFFWTGPHYLVGGALAGLFHYWNEFAGWETAVLIFPIVYLVYRSYSLYLGRLEEEKRHVTEVADLHLRTIQTLTLAIDARDGTTFGHLRRVQVYARELARELGLPEDERRALDAAALLHDIGKLAVPEHIISKPGRLTPEEFEKMKVHPVVGAEILENVRFPYPVVPIVRAHHEKWNGTGYPYGLKGEEIPMGARIIAIADAYDTITSERTYKKTRTPDEAFLELERCGGAQFDPELVRVFVSRLRDLPNPLLDPAVALEPEVSR